MKITRMTALGVAAVAAVVGLAACSSSSSPSSNTGAGSSAAGSSSAAAKGKITIGSANFGESTIIANIYADELKSAGYSVTLKPNIGSRDVYIKALESGEIDAVPEYIGTAAEYFNAAINGANAPTTKPVATTDPTTTVAALRKLVATKNLVAGNPSPAADQNAFAVTKDFAQKNNLTKVSDLAKLNGTLVLGGPPECPQRTFCEIGLEKTYGLKFKSFKALDAGGSLTINALKEGTVQVGLVFSSDGAVAANNLLVLDDDKKLQQADNITYLARNTVPSDAQAIMDKVDAALTTTDLQGLNKQFTVDKDEASDLATQWIKAHPIS